MYDLSYSYARWEVKYRAKYPSVLETHVEQEVYTTLRSQDFPAKSN